MNMDEKKRWFKDKKNLTILFGSGAVIIIAMVVFAAVLISGNLKKDEVVKAGETTTLEQTLTTQETQITTEETTVQATTVTYTSTAVNQFSSTAGSEQDSFYANSVFVGDSVMYGFERYIKGRPGTLGDPSFLTAGSFAARIELTAPTADSPHPLYQGVKTQVCNVLPSMGADKVFLFFGLNDIGMVGVDQTVANYKSVIDNIRANSPTIKIYIISTTYMAAGSELKFLNNANIGLLNQQLEANAPSWGVGFVDVAKYMYDSSGCLVAGYSSDGYVHITQAAYDLWVAVLRDFASKN